MEYDLAFDLVRAEYMRAKRMYPDMQSAYEGLGVITEQYHDLVRVFQTPPQGPPKGGSPNQEFIELAVVCIRYLTDVIP